LQQATLAGIGLTILLAGLLNLAIMGVSLTLVSRAPLLVSLLGSLAAFLVPPLALALVLRPSFGRGLLAWLIWQVGGVLGAVGLVVIASFLGLQGFVVPTGAMADTILGYHKQAVCPNCGTTFTVNASQEAEPLFGQAAMVAGGTCPNCRQHVNLA